MIISDQVTCSRLMTPHAESNKRKFGSEQLIFTDQVNDPRWGVSDKKNATEINLKKIEFNGVENIWLGHVKSYSRSHANICGADDAHPVNHVQTSLNKLRDTSGYIC
ncbi:hypothetical protein NQ317_005186 [Molorchus minor]|uniref:Uncharacterized protein n=1 Tax=Molorchus minor TaxID=1323400 RepID=A0ABQ9J3L2_9CUCU|nr:hypothetical protein NQ317_005186 [Molorchus minor]